MTTPIPIAVNAAAVVRTNPLMVDLRLGTAPIIELALEVANLRLEREDATNPG